MSTKRSETTVSAASITGNGRPTRLHPQEVPSEDRLRDRLDSDELAATKAKREQARSGPQRRRSSRSVSPRATEAAREDRYSERICKNITAIDISMETQW